MPMSGDLSSSGKQSEQALPSALLQAQALAVRCTTVHTHVPPQTSVYQHMLCGAPEYTLTYAPNTHVPRTHVQPSHEALSHLQVCQPPAELPNCSPHGVEQRAIILQPQQLVRCGHVMCDGLLSVVEERVWRPDLAGKEVVERQALHGSLEPQPFVFPALPEEHIYGIFLIQKTTSGWHLSRKGP